MKYVLFFLSYKGRSFSTFYHVVFCKGSFQSKIPEQRTSHSLWIAGKLYSKQPSLMVECETGSSLLHFLLAFRDYQPPQNSALLMHSFQWVTLDLLFLLGFCGRNNAKDLDKMIHSQIVFQCSEMMVLSMMVFPGNKEKPVSIQDARSHCS